MNPLSDSAKGLLIASLLAQGDVISRNGCSLFKGKSRPAACLPKILALKLSCVFSTELAIRKDPRLRDLIANIEEAVQAGGSLTDGDLETLEQATDLIGESPLWLTRVSPICELEAAGFYYRNRRA